MNAAMERSLLTGSSAGCRALATSRPCGRAAPPSLLCGGSLRSVTFRGRSVLSAGIRQTVSNNRRAWAVAADAGWNPPPVSVTKQKFLEGYRRPISPLYNTVLQELLVVQHLLRYNRKYKYDKIFALGFVSVYDQVLDGLKEGEREEIFNVYLTALDEDPKQFRADASAAAEWAKGLSSSAAIVPDADGDDLQKTLADIAARSADNKFLYNRFFAVGLFRLLELTGAKDPKALETLVKAVGVRPELVNRDLLTYKGVLSKLAAAKELFREYLEREKKKAAEREAGKKAPAPAEAPAAAETPANA